VSLFRRCAQAEAERKQEGERRGRAQDELAEARAQLKAADKELRELKAGFLRAHACM
jgi:hypothetical protein